MQSSLFALQDDSATFNKEITHAPGTMVTVLSPRSIVKIPVQFQPKDERLKTSVILIRWDSFSVLTCLWTHNKAGAFGKWLKHEYLWYVLNSNTVRWLCNSFESSFYLAPPAKRTVVTSFWVNLVNCLSWGEGEEWRLYVGGGRGDQHDTPGTSSKSSLPSWEQLSSLDSQLP